MVFAVQYIPNCPLSTDAAGVHNGECEQYFTRPLLADRLEEMLGGVVEVLYPDLEEGELAGLVAVVRADGYTTVSNAVASKRFGAALCGDVILGPAAAFGHE
jgi:hypothetical protein